MLREGPAIGDAMSQEHTAYVNCLLLLLITMYHCVHNCVECLQCVHYLFQCLYTDCPYFHIRKGSVRGIPVTEVVTVSGCVQALELELG